MDTKKAQNLLYKINNLFQSITMSENEISALERDLMKNYIREFYEVLSEIKQSHSTPAIESNHEIQKAQNKIISPSKSFDEKLDRTIEEVKEVVDHPERITRHSEPSKPFDNHNREAQNGQNALEQTSKIQETKQEELASQIPREPTSKIEPIPQPKSEVFNLDPKLEALFATPVVQDLSDKLSSAPIFDLGKAFGVNERILTINELFGGDIQLFNQTIQSINGMRRFEEAKQYLVRNVASPNRWIDETKKNKASNFIKTVRRKFQS